jgi:Kef-type K+ transport system membrane component KefB
MTEPSPILSLVLTIGLAFAVTYIRYMNRADRYQDHIIGGWMLAALLMAWLSEDFMGSAMPSLLWAIISALASSAILHRAFDLLGRERGKNEDQIDKRVIQTECPKEKGRKNTGKDVA